MLPEENLKLCFMFIWCRFLINIGIRDLISSLPFAQSRCHTYCWVKVEHRDNTLGSWADAEELKSGRKFLRRIVPTATQDQIPISLPYTVMTRFRPCIDLHSGQVKQIVGGTLNAESSELKTNYVSKLPSSHYAQLYRDNALNGAHVVMLGLGNEAAAQEALSAWPGALQIGGGINDTNAKQWMEKGAEKVTLSPSIDNTFVGLRVTGRLS